jgi:hypothetical protein
MRTDHATKQLSKTIRVDVASAASHLAIRHLDQAQLARRWNISARTLERWRWLNQGPAFLKIGGRVAYRLEDVESFEISQRRVPTTISDPFFRGRR